MKKWVAVWLALALCIGLVQGLAAEQVSFANHLEQIDELDYAYGVPDDWQKIELTEEEVAWGQIGKWQSPDASETLLVSLEELTEAVPSIEALAEMMKNWKSYSNIELITLGERQYIAYEKTKDGIHGMTTLIEDAEGQQLLVDFDFTFTNADEAALKRAKEIVGLFSEIVVEDGAGAQE